MGEILFSGKKLASIVLFVFGRWCFWGTRSQGIMANLVMIILKLSPYVDSDAARPRSWPSPSVTALCDKKISEYCLWKLSIPNGECRFCLLSSASCIPRVNLSSFNGWGRDLSKNCCVFFFNRQPLTHLPCSCLSSYDPHIQLKLVRRRLSTCRGLGLYIQ